MDIETFLTKQVTPQIDLGAMVDDVLNGLTGIDRKLRAEPR
jgi:hypothetical protein